MWWRYRDADGLQFTPAIFEISVGDTVRWEWEGSRHNVRPDSIPAGSDWSGTEGGDGETYGSGHTFEVAGEYSYYCAPHQSAGMVGFFPVTEQPPGDGRWRPRGHDDELNYRRRHLPVTSGAIYV